MITIRNKRKREDEIKRVEVVADVHVKKTGIEASNTSDKGIIRVENGENNRNINESANINHNGNNFNNANSKRTCVFWVKDKCKYGNDCRYLHPERCSAMLAYGECLKQNCNLFHPKMCRNLKNTGKCARGNSCYYTHQKIIQINRNEMQSENDKGKYAGYKGGRRGSSSYYTDYDKQPKRHHNYPEHNHQGSRNYNEDFFMAEQFELGNHENTDHGESSTNSSRKNYVVKLNIKCRKEPYKLIYQNIRGLVTENSKEKKVHFDEYTTENNVIIINFTETWLDKNIIEDAKIKNFQVFRSDRKGNKRNNRGGVAIYLRDQIEANEISNVSIKKCEMIAIRIEKLNTINIVIYRPPDTSSSVFLLMLKELQEILEKLESPEPTVIISGDFNFPFVNWTRDLSNGCRWEIKPNSNVTVDEKLQFFRLMALVDKHNLVQAVEEPTREKNTLDLVFTNNINIFTDIEVTKSSQSDHNLIELTTNFNTSRYQSDNSETKTFIGEPEFWHLNFHHDDVSWSHINDEINEIPWQILFNGKDTETCTNIFMKYLLILCFKLIPRRKTNSKSKIPKERKKMLNRLKMLKRNKHRACNNIKEKIIEKRILETESKLIEHRKQERALNETRVIGKMENNPKILFDYIKKQKNRDTKIGPFKIDNEYIYDFKEICNLLVKQYNSQFSNGENITKVTSEIFSDIQDGDLADIEIKENDIIDAIGKLNKNSAAGPDGLPAIFLINTKNSIKTPLEIILRKSLDEGKIPDPFKLAYVTPIHKGGSKLKPEQYRPVSLTSHVMKIFESYKKKYYCTPVTTQFNKSRPTWICTWKKYSNTVATTLL